MLKTFSDPRKWRSHHHPVEQMALINSAELERDHYFKQQKEDLLIITKKNSDPKHNYIDERSACIGERVYNLI